MILWNLGPRCIAWNMSGLLTRKVQRAVQETFGDEDKGGLSNDMLLPFRPHPELDFRIPAAEYIRQLRAHQGEVFVAIVGVRCLLHESRLYDNLPPHVNVRPGI